MWCGDPGTVLDDREWFHPKSPLADIEVTWGHLYLSISEDIYRIVRLCCAVTQIQERLQNDWVFGYDDLYCYPLPDFDLRSPNDQVEISVGVNSCSAEVAEGQVACPNSVSPIRRFDFAAIRIEHTAVESMQEFLRQISDPRLAHNVGTVHDLALSHLRPGPLARAVAIDDIVTGRAKLGAGSLVTMPRVSVKNGLFQMVCKHPSSAGLWDVASAIGVTPDHPSAGIEICLPGGLEIDAAIRKSMRDGVQNWLDGSGERPPDPWTDGVQEFHQWLDTPRQQWRPGLSRYWENTWAVRPDLQALFPNPESSNAHAFREWCRRRFEIEQTSLLVGASEDTTDWVEVPDSLSDTGINLIGYLQHSFGLGEIARSIRVSLQDSQLPFAELPYWRSPSESIGAFDPPYHLPHSINLAVVTAHELQYLLAETPQKLWSNHFNVGYWFWEVEGVPEEMVRSSHSVDEIWVATRFIHDALSSRLTTPVRQVPIPIRIPLADDSKGTTSKLQDAPFTFLVTFDYNSVAARKNPEAAITAFRTAFPIDDPSKQRLVLKTMNSSSHRGQVAPLRRLCEGRRDIEVIDSTLTRAEQDELIGSSSCLVSLHRSEGLGLHIAEAMAFGVPVIATGYSGNMDFMTHDNSLPVEYQLVEVEADGPYLGTGVWAEPNIDDAVDKFREIVRNEALARKISTAGAVDINAYSAEARKRLESGLRTLIAQQSEKP